jgi:predicted Fe-S protein YdhL (DUF1289 family)
MTEMPYSEETVARLLVSKAAADVLRRALALMRTDQDTGLPGDLTHHVDYLRKSVLELMDHAVAAELSRGASWADIGTSLGMSRQSAHRRHAQAVKGIETDMVTGWLRDAVRRGADETFQWASLNDTERLDVQARRIIAALEDIPEDQAPTAPVSGGQQRMERDDFYTRLEAAERRLAEAEADPDTGPWELRSMRVACARRRVQWYEILQADEDASPGSAGIPQAMLTELLAAARRHREELEWARS